MMHLLLPLPFRSALSTRASLMMEHDETFDDNPFAALFETTGWAQLTQELDGIPAFACANALGESLCYADDRLQGTPAVGLPLKVFYAELSAALQALASAEALYPSQELQLISEGLGSAFRQSCEGSAILIPSSRELEVAGAPAGMPPAGQPLPLFAYEELCWEEPDDSLQFPLFMSSDEASAAAIEAVARDGGDLRALEMVCLPLPQAVETALMDVQAPDFTFVAPAASLEYLRGAKCR
jgi:hypothetical protein